MFYLGVDHGTKKIGLAIADSEVEIAYPIAAFYKNNIDENNDELFHHIESLIKKYNIDKIIVGMPVSQEGKHTNQSDLVMEFVENLKEKFGINVKTWNELNTSQIAKLNRSNQKRNLKNLDSEAARIILQEFIDYKNLKI